MLQESYQENDPHGEAANVTRATPRGRCTWSSSKTHAVLRRRLLVESRREVGTPVRKTELGERHGATAVEVVARWVPEALVVPVLRDRVTCHDCGQSSSTVCRKGILHMFVVPVLRDWVRCHDCGWSLKITSRHPRCVGRAYYTCL
jgi:hypothetical protein